MDVLTRPAPADENAGSGQPRPRKGRGHEFNSFLPSPLWAGSEGVMSPHSTKLFRESP